MKKSKEKMDRDLVSKSCALINYTVLLKGFSPLFVHHTTLLSTLCDSSCELNKKNPHLQSYREEDIKIV